MGVPGHLTCILRNLGSGQEATVRTRHGTTDWFQIGKGVLQDCILSPCLFNLYAEYIMRNARLDEAQTGIKIAGRNIDNLRYAAICKASPDSHFAFLHFFSMGMILIPVSCTQCHKPPSILHQALHLSDLVR